MGGMKAISRGMDLYLLVFLVEAKEGNKNITNHRS